MNASYFCVVRFGSNVSYSFLIFNFIFGSDLFKLWEKIVYLILLSIMCLLFKLNQEFTLEGNVMLAILGDLVSVGSCGRCLESLGLVLELMGGLIWVQIL